MKHLKQVFSFVFILLSYIMNAQAPISIEYKELWPSPEYISGGTNIYKLILYPNYSVYFQSNYIKNNSPYFVDGEPEDKFKKANDLLFKFYQKKNILFLSQKINKTNFVVSDSLNLMKWKIQKSKPVRYLGLDCYEAKAHFRGRNYTAYFAPKIKKSDGPFKFSGLPGLIVKISADDQYKIWQAIKINYNEKTIVGITEKFKERPIPFHTYARWQKIEDKRVINDLIKSNPTPPGETRTYEFPHLEKNLQL
jgi:GLPGLI family protein